MYQKQRKEYGASSCPGPVLRLAGSHVLLMTSPNTPPLMPSSYHVTHLSLSSSEMCPELLARDVTTWRWLVWRISGCTGGRKHSNYIGTCKRKHRLRQPPKSVTRARMIRTTDLLSLLHGGVGSLMSTCDMIKMTP